MFENIIRCYFLNPKKYVDRELLCYVYLNSSLFVVVTIQFSFATEAQWLFRASVANEN